MCNLVAISFNGFVEPLVELASVEDDRSANFAEEDMTVRSGVFVPDSDVPFIPFVLAGVDVPLCRELL